MAEPGGMPVESAAGRVFDAGLHLLDRQIVDRDGRLAGNVDDLELSDGDEGPPIVTALLSGPGALAPRIGGRLGLAWRGVARRLHDEPDGPPARVPFGVVTAIEQAIHVSTPADELDSARFERWVRVHVIAKIPGASHAPEGDSHAPEGDSHAPEGDSHAPE